MPKIEVSDQKGLVQLPGNGTLSGHKKVVESITTTKVLTIADSGKVFTIDADGGAYNITLPTGSANVQGWNAMFVLSDIANTNVDVKIIRGDTVGDTLVGNSIDTAANGAAGIVVTGNEVVFAADGGDAVGDLAEVFCYSSTASASLFVARAICAA